LRTTFPLLCYPGIASNEGELELEVGGGHPRRDTSATYTTSELGRHGLWNGEWVSEIASNERHPIIIRTAATDTSTAPREKFWRCTDPPAINHCSLTTKSLGSYSTSGVAAVIVTSELLPVFLHLPSLNPTHWTFSLQQYIQQWRLWCFRNFYCHLPNLNPSHRSIPVMIMMPFPHFPSSLHLPSLEPSDWTCSPQQYTDDASTIPRFLMPPT
jgi:hypothetical protein